MLEVGTEYSKEGAATTITITTSTTNNDCLNINVDRYLPTMVPKVRYLVATILH